jgi:ABC-type antimicrobial peptide transport system permease subunit
MDLPFRGASYTAGVTVAGAEPVDSVVFNFVGPAFFKTLGIPMLAGRDFAEGDLGEGRPVAVIGQSLASHYFAGRNAVGERLEIGDATVEIIGVVRDVPYAQVRSERELVVYRPYAHERRIGVPGTFVVRTGLPPAALLATVRGVLRDIAPGVPIGSVLRFDTYFDGSIATERLLAGIAAFFGLMALLLIAVGVYGTLASLVVQRSNEFRVRLALGATGHGIARMVVASALIPVAFGLLAGLPVAFAVTRMAESTLFGITSRDPLTYAASVGVLLSIAALAAAVPARNAARTDAVGSLRVE